MFFQWYSFVMLVHLISSIVTVLCLKSSYLKKKNYFEKKSSYFPILENFDLQRGNL